jgi:hypothetical protein
MLPSRRRKSCCIAAIPLLLGTGCAYHNTPNGTVLGTAPLTWTFQVSPAPDATSVTNPSTVGPNTSDTFGTPKSLPSAANDLTGVYSGQAISTYASGPISKCTDIAINRSFTVDGQRASFFAFRGTISPDGRLVMQAGDQWLSGRFIGRTFQGELLRKYPACSWNLSLTAE